MPKVVEGAAAVRHYQVGFGHHIIPNSKNSPTASTSASSASRQQRKTHGKKSRSMSSIIDTLHVPPRSRDQDRDQAQSQSQSQSQSQAQEQPKKMRIGIEKDEVSQFEEMNQLDQTVSTWNPMEQQSPEKLLSEIESILQSEDIAPIVRAIENIPNEQLPFSISALDDTQTQFPSSSAASAS
ncbi:hypothetical protein RFI_07829, partial [Reticulomyxa filosa]